MTRSTWLSLVVAAGLAISLPGVALAQAGPVEVACSALSATVTSQPLTQASSAGFDCVTKAGDFCWGELGKGNQCVSSTTCTPTQLAECLPGFPMCPKVEPAPGPTPYPEY